LEQPACSDVANVSKLTHNTSGPPGSIPAGLFVALQFISSSPLVFYIGEFTIAEAFLSRYFEIE